MFERRDGLIQMILILMPNHQHQATVDKVSDSKSKPKRLI